MMAEKLFIKNRDEKKISVLIEQPSRKPEGLAFVAHGLSGFKEEPQRDWPSKSASACRTLWGMAK